MSKNTLFQPLGFPNGTTISNRFMLAPMTNTQSHKDGTLSDDEYNWLVKRAEGDFGLVSTCASHVAEQGKGFPGQLGIFSDNHIPGHKRLAKGIKDEGGVAIIQLHHAGIRSPKELIGEVPVGPSAHEKTGSRALSLEEVKVARDQFVEAAFRAKKCGYDGVEIHGAHGYLLCQFLSAEYNRREDEYGGSLENRARIIKEIISGIREKCGKEFFVGLRLSPERMGLQLEEIKQLCLEIDQEQQVDFLDISLWDSFKMPEEDPDGKKTLLEHFTNLGLKYCKLTVAGKIYGAEEVRKIMESGVDFVCIGRSGILHYDFPEQVKANPNFRPIATPVTRDYLKKQGLGKEFINYMSKWEGFVEG